MSTVVGDLHARMIVQRSDVFALDIDLTIEPGTTAALLGPNGSGKSTTVDALAGLVPLDHGSIALGGRVLDDPDAGVYIPPEARRVGVVFQDYLLFEHLDVTDNIAFGPIAAGRSRRDARAIARGWMETFELEDLAGRRPAQLSGGQAQRVALARTLAAEPDLLLLDEPLAALDVTSRTRLRRTLASHLADYPGPRLMITHDPTDAFLLADRIHIIEAGRITQCGSPADIRRRPLTPYVAALAGVNLLTGTSSGGELVLDGYAHLLHSSDTHTTGPVLITIHPNAVALHVTEPHGSPRNSWHTTVAGVEPLGDITRILLDQPLPLSVDITPESAEALRLALRTPIWASIKATEIHINPA